MYGIVNSNFNRIYVVNRDGNVMAYINPCLPRLGEVFRRIVLAYVVGVDEPDIIIKTIYSNVVMIDNNSALIFVMRLTIDDIHVHVMTCIDLDGELRWCAHMGVLQPGIRFESHCLTISLKTNIMTVVSQILVDTSPTKLEIPVYDAIENIVNFVYESDTELLARISYNKSFLYSLCPINVFNGRFIAVQEFDTMNGINRSQEPFYRRLACISVVYDINQQCIIADVHHTDESDDDDDDDNSSSNRPIFPSTTIMKLLTNDDWIRAMLEYV